MDEVEAVGPRRGSILRSQESTAFTSRYTSDGLPISADRSPTAVFRQQFYRIGYFCATHPFVIFFVTFIVPFDVSDRIDSPSSLYAATKKSNEDFARVYHHLYKIPMTGLRFFTVYGPWGRPDMAVYKFSAQIMENRSIDVYDEGTLQRDFTYIDDIVDGIKAAINHGANFEIFNIGKGHPETVSDLIAGLENVLEKRANKNYLPMQPGDVKITYADIGHTRSQLGFAPKISLQEGLYRWAAWYLERREDLERGNFVRQKEYYEKQIETGVSQESTLVTAVPKIRKGGTAGGVVLTSILEYSEAAMNCLKSLYRYQIPSIVFVSKEVLSTLDTVTFKNATVQILLIGDDELWRMNCFRHLKAHLLGLVKMQKAPEYLVFVESKKVDFSRNPFSDIQRTHKENGFTFFLQLEVYRSYVLTQDCKACFGLSERGFDLGQLNSTHESAFSPDIWGGPFDEFMFLLDHMNSVLYTEKKLLYSEITIECMRVAFIIAVKRLAGYARISAGHGGSKDKIFSPARSEYCTGTQASYAVYHLPVCKSSH